MKIKKSDLDKIIQEELGLMNGNGSAYGLPSNWADKVMPEFEVELEEEHEAGVEALQELGMFLAKLANEGYNELAEDLDEILGKIRNAGLLAEHPDAIQEGLDESDWGGFGGSKRVAPLDTYSDPNDEGAMSYEEQLQFFEYMVSRGDRDPHEVLNYPEHFQNGLSFPDLGEDDVEDILSKLGLPEMNDPKWQRYTIGQKAVREGKLDENALIDFAMLDYLWKNLKVPGVIEDFINKGQKKDEKGRSVNDKIDDWFKNNIGNPLVRGLYKALMMTGPNYGDRYDDMYDRGELKETVLNALSEEFYNSLSEKSKSKAQQRFMGMVNKCQKDGDCASPEIEKAAGSMKKKDVKDFAKTKHDGLPNKVPKEK